MLVYFWFKFFVEKMMPGTYALKFTTTFNLHRTFIDKRFNH